MEISTDRQRDRLGESDHSIFGQLCIVCLGDSAHDFSTLNSSNMTSVIREWIFDGSPRLSPGKISRWRESIYIFQFNSLLLSEFWSFPVSLEETYRFPTKVVVPNITDPDNIVYSRKEMIVREGLRMLSFDKKACRIYRSDSRRPEGLFEIFILATAYIVDVAISLYGKSSSQCRLCHVIGDTNETRGLNRL